MKKRYSINTLSAFLIVTAVLFGGAVKVHGESPVFEGSASNVWIFDSEGEASGAYNFPAWTDDSSYDPVLGSVSIFGTGGPYKIDNIEASEFVVINGANNGLPEADSSLPLVSVIGLNAATLSNDGNPGVTISPSPGAYDETVKVIISGIPAPGHSGEMVIHWIIDSGPEQTKTAAEAEFFLAEDRTYSIEYWASQDGDTSEHKTADYDLNVPNSQRDTDGDGIPDIWEANKGLDPLGNDILNDTDGDGWSDFDEIIRGSDPNDPDSEPLDIDMDGWSDFDEYLRGTNPRDPVLVDTDPVGAEGHGEADSAVQTAPDDSGISVATDSAGNVYITGTSSGSDSSDDYFTVKYDTDGNELWRVYYNGAKDRVDRAAAIAVDNLGNVYVTGESDEPLSYTDYATIKYDSDGNQEWAARYNGPGNSHDTAHFITVDANGYIYVTGQSTGSGTGYDYTTIKYDSDGIEQWVAPARYNGSGNDDDRAYSIVVDSSGNVYVTGWSIGSGTGYDYATIKYNADGIEQWVAPYNGPGNDGDFASSIALDTSGNVYVTGNSTGEDTYRDLTTIKYDADDGTALWEDRYSGPEPHGLMAYGRTISVGPSGNVYVAGYSYIDDGSGSIVPSNDSVLLKYDYTNGDRIWDASYNSNPRNSRDYHDEASAIVVDSSENIYVIGNSNHPITNSDEDCLTIKYDSAGTELWVSRFDGPGIPVKDLDCKSDTNGDGTVDTDDCDGVPDHNPLTHRFRDSDDNGAPDRAVYPDRPTATRIYEVESLISGGIYQDPSLTTLQANMDKLSVLDIFWRTLYDQDSLPEDTELADAGLSEGSIPLQYRAGTITTALNQGRLNIDTLPDIVRIPSGRPAIVRARSLDIEKDLDCESDTNDDGTVDADDCDGEADFYP